MLQERSKLILIAVVSFFLGWLFCSLRNKNKKTKVDNKTSVVDEDLNKTIVQQEEGKYFLVFNSVVILSREITKEQYDTFIGKFPTGKADGNVINQYSTVPNKYTSEDGYYYESKWDGSAYSAKMVISKEEYDHFTKSNAINIEKIIS